MNRKIILVLMVLVAVLAFVGCKNVAEDTTGGTTGGTTTTYLSGQEWYTSKDPVTATFKSFNLVDMIFAETGNSVEIRGFDASGSETAKCNGTYSVTGTALAAGNELTIRGITADFSPDSSCTFNVTKVGTGGVMQLLCTSDGKCNIYSDWNQK